MFWFDEGDLVAGLLFAMVELMMLALIVGSVARVVMRQRAREHLFRIRIARWRAAESTRETAGPQGG
jgi:hypothetical protein